MKEIIKLALRNLKEHKSKSIIISLFILFGVAIVILGNSFLESINRGLEKDFRSNITGDIAVCAIPPKGVSVDVFGASSMEITSSQPQIPALMDIDTVEKIIAETDGVTKYSRMISAQVMLSKGIEFDFSALEENDDADFSDIPFSMLFAGEKDSYWELFPDLNMIEGRYPQAGTNEIIVDTRVMDGFKKIYKEDLQLNDNVLLANMNGTIREAVVVGFFKPANEYSAMFQSIYSTPELARAFADLTYANSFSQELPDTVDLGISNMSEDDLFGDNDFFGDIEDDESILGSTTDFDSILGDTTLRDELNKTDDGAWHFILAKLENPHMDKKTVAELNKIFKEKDLAAQAMDWKKAALSYSGTVAGIGMIFNVLIVILAVVVFIIIMNTMVVSVIERTSEIGTMRAIGAEKKFVKRLFSAETLILTSLSALFGIVFAFFCMAIFNACHIVITNSIAKMILGGGLLHFTPTWEIILVTIIITLIGSLLSNLYPVKSALKVTPLKALSKE
ncbi:MAG: FtsX-like permease family protein [Spirochaetales bacterium]|nr:FtsX-like permease family protein [Spirochaetales bacterium]